MQAASPRGLTLVYKHKEKGDEPPPPGAWVGGWLWRLDVVCSSSRCSQVCTTCACLFDMTHAGMESGIKMVLTSAMGSLEVRTTKRFYVCISHAALPLEHKHKKMNTDHTQQEAGHEDLTDAVYREALRRGALDGYWSAGACVLVCLVLVYTWVVHCMYTRPNPTSNNRNYTSVHPGVMDLHNKTVPLARAAVRHCYAETLLLHHHPPNPTSPSLLAPTAAADTDADANGTTDLMPFFEIIIGRGEHLSPAVLRLLNEEFAPPQDARVKADNTGRIQVPRERIRAWVAAREGGGG